MASKTSKIDTTAAKAAVAALKGTCPTYCDVFEAARAALPALSANASISDAVDYDQIARRITDAWDKARRGGSLRGDLPRVPQVW